MMGISSNRFAILILVVVVGMLGFFENLQAQTSSPQESEARPKTFRVAGTIVSAAGPLAHARVFLTNTKNLQNPQNQLWTTASEGGHFEFNHVAEGKYSLEGAERGYIRQAYNQHEQYSTAIVTGPEMATESLVLRLAPDGMISVKVTDESSEPVRKASVLLYRENRQTGVRRVMLFRSASTDDLGSCEFTRLNPGAYFLSVTATPWYALHPASLKQDGQDDPPANDMRPFDVVYPSTYYGDTTDPDSAAPIVIKGGDQAQAGIHLSPVAALHLIFHASEDTQHGIATPMLQSIGFDGAATPQIAQTQQISPGLFEITGIAPGRYKASLPGSSPVEVDAVTDGQDLSEIKGEATSSIKVSARVLGESKIPQFLFVQLHSSDGKIASVQPVDQKGEANFTNVSPGDYNLLAVTMGKIYSVVNVSVEGGQTTGHSLNVPSGSSLSVSISLTGTAVNVEGFAKRDGKPASGAMVVLVPMNPESNRELFRRDQTDLDGSFNLLGVAPGAYTVVAIEDGWDLDWALPSVIAPYIKNGESVTISDQPGHSMQLPKNVEVQPHR